MSIELISNNHDKKLNHLETLCNILSSTKNKLHIISPFIGCEIAKIISEVKSKNKKIDCKVITRFYRADFIQGANHLSALKDLFDSGVEIYALKALHTKLYLFGDNIALIGSANLTSGGFKSNHELSILLKNEDIISEMHCYYQDTLKQIKNSGDFQITLERINKEMPIVEKLKKDRKTNEKDNNDKRFGATISTSQPQNRDEDSPDTIQTILSQIVDDENDFQAWIKFEESSNERENPNEYYKVCATEDYPDGITCFPKRPSGIKENDHIYLAAICLAKENTKAGIKDIFIVGKARTFGFENNIATSKMKKKYRWMEKYPNFIQLRDIEYLNTAQKNGISLLELLENVGTDTYSSTVGKNRSMDQLKKSHRRQSHLRLTPKAKKYLDARFSQFEK